MNSEENMAWVRAKYFEKFGPFEAEDLDNAVLEAIRDVVGSSSDR